MKIIGARHLPYERGKLSGKACRAFRFNGERFFRTHQARSARPDRRKALSPQAAICTAPGTETAGIPQYRRALPEPFRQLRPAMHPANRPVRKRMGILCEKYKNLPVPKSIRIGRESPPRKNRRKTKEIERNNRKRSGILIIYRHIRRKTIGKARKASENGRNGRNGRNDKSRPEGSLPMPQTPQAKDQRIVQSMPEQPQIGTSRPVAPVHAPGERHVGAPPFGKNPFIKLIGRESFRLPHLARTHRHDGQRQAAVPSALEQQDIPVPVIVVRSDRPVFPEHAVADIIGIATGYADAEIDVVQMEVAKEFLVERMFAPDRLGHDQALAVHLNDRRKVGFSGPVFRADHTPTGMPVQTGTHVTLQPSRQRRRPRFERVPEEPDHARSRRSPVKIDDRAGPRVGPERESSCRKHKQSFLAREA